MAKILDMVPWAEARGWYKAYGGDMPIWETRHLYQAKSTDPTGLCIHCGRQMLQMIPANPPPYGYLGGLSSFYSNQPQLLHSNVRVNITARKGEPMGYEIEAWEGQEVDVTPRVAKRQMAFNQFSQLLQRARQDHNLLDQDEVWVNRDGLKVLLKDMSARYASNVLAWLRRAAKEYHSSWATWEFVTKYSDQSATDFEELLDQTITDAKAKEWIKETVLYKALATIAKNSV